MTCGRPGTAPDRAASRKWDAVRRGASSAVRASGPSSGFATRRVASSWRSAHPAPSLPSLIPAIWASEPRASFSSRAPTPSTTSLATVRPSRASQAFRSGSELTMVPVASPSAMRTPCAFDRLRVNVSSPLSLPHAHPIPPVRSRAGLNWPGPNMAFAHRHPSSVLVAIETRLVAAAHPTQQSVAGRKRIAHPPPSLRDAVVEHHVHHGGQI